MICEEIKVEEIWGVQDRALKGDVIATSCPYYCRLVF